MAQMTPLPEWNERKHEGGIADGQFGDCLSVVCVSRDKFMDEPGSVSRLQSYWLWPSHFYQKLKAFGNAISMSGRRERRGGGGLHCIFHADHVSGTE